MRMKQCSGDYLGQYLPKKYDEDEIVEMDGVCVLCIVYTNILVSFFGLRWTRKCWIFSLSSGLYGSDHSFGNLLFLT